MFNAIEWKLYQLLRLPTGNLSAEIQYTSSARVYQLTSPGGAPSTKAETVASEALIVNRLNSSSQNAKEGKSPKCSATLLWPESGKRPRALWLNWTHVMEGVVKR